VDGLDKPWCYYGTGDDDWGYCNASCDKPAASGAKCSVTTGGKTCDKWGENDFDLDPSSNACEQVDGVDKPWCYYGTGDDDWDYCDCKATQSDGGDVGIVDDDVADSADETLTVSTDHLHGSAKAKSSEESSTDDGAESISFKQLMIEGKVTRWWWDMLNPHSQRLTDVNFDEAIGSTDYYAVFFFGPFCEACQQLSVDWDKIASNYAQTRIDTAFGRVNCGHGDQTYRPPTEAELEAGDPTAWGEYKNPDVCHPSQLLPASVGLLDPIRY
jgi:hypothetical protein